MSEITTRLFKSGFYNFSVFFIIYYNNHMTHQNVHYNSDLNLPQARVDACKNLVWLYLFFQYFLWAISVKRKGERLTVDESLTLLLQSELGGRPWLWQSPPSEDMRTGGIVILILEWTWSIHTGIESPLPAWWQPRKQPLKNKHIWSVGIWILLLNVEDIWIVLLGL